MSRAGSRLASRTWMGLLLAVLVSFPAVAEVRILNNLVTELLEVSQPPATPHARYTFTNPRDGWVFIASNAATPGGASVHLVLDSDDRDAAVAVHGVGKEAPKGSVTPDRPAVQSILETMRHLPAGEHTLNVYCDGSAVLNGVIVRAIPEIFYPGVGYWPIRGISKHAPYNWEFLKRIGMPDNVNVINERQFDEGLDAERWRKQGKKILTAEWTHQLIDERNKAGLPFTADWAYEFLTGTRGLKRPDRDGIIMSEFSGYTTHGITKNEKEYPALIEAVERLAADPALDGKVFYPYCGWMYEDRMSMAFVKELIKAGYKIVEERYLCELPTEQEAKAAIQYGLGHVMGEYQKAMPGIQKHMLWALGYLSAPLESLNLDPGVNYAVYLDMQFNFIANDPAFSGVYGIMCYHPAYTDEETLRWSAKLFRHYCIEGRTDMLSPDPYILPHIQNPDFADGATGWTLSPAEDGSMEVRNWEGYGRRQTRYPGYTFHGYTPAVKGQGDSFLWTKRSAERPNIFSQGIRHLKPGRLYSLKMFTGARSPKQKLQVGIRIDSAALVPYKSFQEMYVRDILGVTYHFLVFRARSETATLIVSDWVSDDPAPWPTEWGLQLNIAEWTKSGKPGGPIGQELMHNFIEVQPYLED